MTEQKKGKTFVVGAVLGGVLGAVTALLLAPKSGRELRKDIADQYDTVSEKAKDIAGTVGSKTKEVAGAIGDTTVRLANAVSAQTSSWFGRGKEQTAELTVSGEAWQQDLQELEEAGNTVADERELADVTGR